jgi:dTDP-4-amino-4,6-dideoxygalactose transaminase
LINVTKTYLPPLEEYEQYLKIVWETNQVTNYGPLVLELEEKLRKFLGVRHIFFVTNGTIALQIAIKALDLHNDIITTPFSYVATCSSIVWEGCHPVFVDIHPETLTLDPDLIEYAITPMTTAILATHVYGYPCNVERIQQIADKHNIKVVYDAAHAFGVRYKNTSLMNYGDISTLSFHATKLFHTGEGGALVTNDDVTAQRIEYMVNFGHKGQEEFWGLGINGKNSELHAAMGLCVLPKVPDLIEKRKALCDLYDKLLKGSSLTRPLCAVDTDYNYAYYPVIFESEQAVIKAKKALNEKDIFPRRYFYPSLNSLPYVTTKRMEVSEDISTRILCLPLSSYLLPEEVNLICETLLSA